MPPSGPITPPRAGNGDCRFRIRLEAIAAVHCVASTLTIGPHEQVVTKASEELASLAVDIARLRARIEGTSQAAQREEVATALLSPDSIPPVPVIPDQQSPLSPTYDQDEPHGAYPEEGAPKRLALGEADGMHIMPAAQGGRDRRAGVARKAAAAPYDSAHCKKIITDHYADLQSIYFESANYRRPTGMGLLQLAKGAPRAPF